jgi:threonine aldolase
LIEQAIGVDTARDGEDRQETRRGAIEMTDGVIDLRSDTVTRPSPGMRRAMAEAEVGDDVFGDDPTVKRLEARVAAMLGKDRGLFLPSGTMANEVALRVLTQPGDEVICEQGSHIYNYEVGAAAALAGVQLRPLEGSRGVLRVEQIEHAIRPSDIHLPVTRVVCLENTHTRAGGAIFPLEEMHGIRELTGGAGIAVYLDGARLWNASARTGIALDEYAAQADSVSVCLSKGLGAPVGSVFVGDHSMVERARRYRKMYGGGMRQVGILAAAGLYALEHNIARLEEDHRRAAQLAEAVEGCSRARLVGGKPDTNMVVLEVLDGPAEASRVQEELAARSVLVVPFGASQLRAVTHLDIGDGELEKAISVFRAVLS